MHNVNPQPRTALFLLVMGALFSTPKIEAQSKKTSPKKTKLPSEQTLKVELPQSLDPSETGGVTSSGPLSESRLGKNYPGTQNRSWIEAFFISVGVEQFDQMALNSSTPLKINYRNDALPDLSLGLRSVRLSQIKGVETHAITSLEIQSYQARDTLTIAGRKLEDSQRLFAQSLLIGFELSKSLRTTQNIALQTTLGPSIAFSTKGLRSSAQNHYGLQMKVNLRWSLPIFQTPVFVDAFMRQAKLDQDSRRSFGLGLGAQFR